MRKKTRARRRSGVTWTSVTVTRLQARITRLAQQERRQLGADTMRDPIAPMMVGHPPSDRSVVQELDAFLAELGELETVDELHDFRRHASTWG